MKRNYHKSILIFIIGVLYNNPSFSANDSLLVLQNTNVIDVVSNRTISNVDVVIEGKLIKNITPFHPKNTYLNARTINAKDCYCIPGLIDSHVHISEPTEPLSFLLKNGITSVRDMVNDAEYLRNIITEIDSGNIIGPDIYYSAMMGGKDFIESSGKVKALTPSSFEPGDAPWARKIDDQSDIAEVVKQAKDCGAYALKLYKDLTYDQVKKLTEEGHKQGLLVWAHGKVYPATCDQIIDAGVDCISHYAYFLSSDNFSEKPNAERTFFDDDIVSFRNLERRLLKMKSQRIFLDPTIFAIDDLIMQQIKKGADAYMSLGYYAIKRAHELGIPIVAGTDLGNNPNDTINLFQELKSLVYKVGLTPFEALQCATINGARVLHMGKSLGSIEVNKMADLVVLSNDPTIDIKNILSIKYVIKSGKILFNINHLIQEK